MKALLRNFLARCLRKLQPKPNLESENRFLTDALNKLVGDQIREQRMTEARERVAELIEARQMAGAGPWRTSKALLEDTDRLIDLAASSIQRAETGVRVRETAPIVAQGATGDIELALQNVEWRREINLSWLEFSRWGIQQIILISRLYYVKNPWIQRGLNIVAQYVFGRGYEVSSQNSTANDTLKDFLERNKKTLGQAALMHLQNRLGYDGQLFFAFFTDALDTGEVNVRTIDATEIFEIVTNPEDTDEPWLYHRKWTATFFNAQTGGVGKSDTKEAYYPALGWTPDTKSGFAGKPKQIGAWPILWGVPVYQLKGGTGVSKWHFDTPKVFAALDWAKNGRRLLEADLTTHLALSQIAMTLSTKGGQQAIEGAKQQLMTTVGPTSNLYDMNPPAVTGATFASGPGTELGAFKTRGMGGDPSDVKEYRNMVACVLEIPPTFLADMETSNLSTAQTLDRPTELAMMSKQEVWRECLTTIAKYVLSAAQGAASNKLRESARDWRIIECQRVKKPNGSLVYEPLGVAEAAAAKVIEVQVDFPAIREGDQLVQMQALVAGVTFGNTAGAIVGIDERAAVRRAYQILGFDDGDELTDDMYPEPISGKPGRKGYEIDRTKEPPKPPAPPPPAALPPGAHPSEPGAPPPHPAATVPAKAQEAARRLIAAVQSLPRRNGHARTE